MTEDENKNEADIDETVVEDTDGADEDFHPFDELREDYKPSAIKKVIAADGMPTNHAPVRNNDIPPLSVDTLVCMGDFSKFVQRDEWGFQTREVEPSDVTRAPNGDYCYREKTSVGVMLVKVEPIRPPCRHYVRQMVSFEFNADHDSIKRLCAARRTTEGAFMTVKDTKVTACDMREPKHIESEQLLDDFDDKKVKQGQERVFASIFSTEGTK